MLHERQENKTKQKTTTIFKSVFEHMWIFFLKFFFFRFSIADKLDKQNNDGGRLLLSYSVRRFLAFSWFYDYAIKSDEIISQHSSTSIYLTQYLISGFSACYWKKNTIIKKQTTTTSIGVSVWPKLHAYFVICALNTKIDTNKPIHIWIIHIYVCLYIYIE